MTIYLSTLFLADIDNHNIFSRYYYQFLNSYLMNEFKYIHASTLLTSLLSLARGSRTESLLCHIPTPSDEEVPNLCFPSLEVHSPALWLELEDEQWESLGHKLYYSGQSLQRLWEIEFGMLAIIVIPSGK